jgi:hypothetical protein
MQVRGLPTPILDQTIQSARTLTFEISPPVLYDLDLDTAVHGEQAYL